MRLPWGENLEHIAITTALSSIGGKPTVLTAGLADGVTLEVIVFNEG